MFGLRQSWQTGFKNQKGSAFRALPMFGQEERATKLLRRVSVRERFGLTGGQDNGAHVRGVATIGSACGQRVRPHLFIRQTMGADALRGGELLRKQLYLGKRSQFKINNGYVSTVPGDCIAQLIQITGHIDNAEMVIQ